MSWEREEEILNQFKDNAGKQVTANEIKAVLDEACGKDTGRVYVYNVLKRHGWRKKMGSSRKVGLKGRKKSIEGLYLKLQHKQRKLDSMLQRHDIEIKLKCQQYSCESCMRNVGVSNKGYR